MAEEILTPSQHTCKSCGNVFTGLYCNQCGEKVIEPKDRSMLRTQMYYLFHSGMVRSLVVDRVVKEGLSLEGFTMMYDAKTTGLAKLLMVIFVLLASLPLSHIFRKKNRYFTDHVALSVELACYNMFVNAILLSGVLWVLNKIFRWSGSGLGDYLNDTTFTIIFISTNLYFIYRATGCCCFL